MDRTPGKWRFKPWSDKEGQIVAGAILNRDGPLLSAAPDLLTALTDLRNECGGTPRPGTLLTLLSAADKAIALLSSALRAQAEALA